MTEQVQDYDIDLDNIFGKKGNWSATPEA